MKDFLLIANQNAITYKEFFPYLKNKEVRPGYFFNKSMEYIVAPDFEARNYRYDEEGNKLVKVPGIAWFTTLTVNNQNKLTLTKRYDPELYPTYDNYAAIEVGKCKDIPYDYEGVMGVPITVLKYDLDNVEVIECLNDDSPETRVATVNGKEKYARVLIKKKIELIDLCASHSKEVRNIPNENCYLNGKWKYPRLLIRRQDPDFPPRTIK